MPSKKKSFLPAALNIFLALFLLFGIFFSFHEALAAAAGCVCNNEANCPSTRREGGSMSAVEVSCTQYCTGLGGLCPLDGGGVARFVPYWPCVCCDGTDLVERSEEACNRDCGEHGGVATGGDPAAIHVSDCPETPGVHPPGCYCDGTLYEMTCSAESDCRSSRCSLSTTVSCVPGYTPPTSRIPGCYCSGTLTREMACTTYTECQDVCPSGTAATDILCTPGYSPPPAMASGTSGSGDPDNNPLCWRKIQCENNCPVDGGCIFQDSSEYPPCSGGAGDWGRCLPKSAPIRLQIPIMGVQDITDLSAYIALMYKYLIGIGGILAGVMIVIGGLLYLTAGTSDRVSSAKSYISSALIGLVLLLTSYLLLQTVNPRLVQISSFTIPLIRPARLPVVFCEELPTPTAGQPPLKFASASASGSAEPKPFSEIRETAFTITDFSELTCGAPYYEETVGDEFCRGMSCKNFTGQAACLPDPSNPSGYHCAGAGLVLKIEGTPRKINGIEGWEYDSSGSATEWNTTTLEGGLNRIAGEMYYIGIQSPDDDDDTTTWRFRLLLDDSDLTGVDDRCDIDGAVCSFKDLFHTGVISADFMTLTTGDVVGFSKNAVSSGNPTPICVLDFYAQEGSFGECNGD